MAHCPQTPTSLNYFTFTAFLRDCSLSEFRPAISLKMICVLAGNFFPAALCVVLPSLLPAAPSHFSCYQPDHTSPHWLDTERVILRAPQSPFQVNQVSKIITQMLCSLLVLVHPDLSPNYMLKHLACIYSRHCGVRQWEEWWESDWMIPLCTTLPIC